MRGLKEHKFMDLFTVIGYLVAIVVVIVGLIFKTWSLYLIGAVIIIFIFRLIGYGIDRMKEMKDNK